MPEHLRVLVPVPAHSGLAATLTYTAEQDVPAGTLVRVPLGRREVLGLVWDGHSPAFAAESDTVVLRPISAVLTHIPPLPASWRALLTFCSDYYQRSLGEVALAALPPQLRELTATQLTRRLKRKPAEVTQTSTSSQEPALTSQQAVALEQMHTQPGPFLLFGATGSGKTEVYLQAVQRMLARDPQAQALVLVPEINLTPQLQARFVARFGPEAVAALHSGMTPAQRLAAWLAAHLGAARVVLGTRLAVLASMARLRLIVVDEEHDPSYKQQEGARYSARDLAVYRGRLEGAQVVLGSATPSLESWHAAQRGRYQRLDMPERVASAAGVAAALPTVQVVDMRLQPPGTLFAPALLEALQARMARGEQSMVLLNRRGYAPVLACNTCDWKSACPHCSAYRVFHKPDRSLRCHHCGEASAVPRACPSCGNPDIHPVGRGTQRLEEQLAQLLAAAQPQRPARILRMDADTTRLRGALQSQLAQVHGGDVDVLVGTQMVAKGHDFRRITLVAAVNPDGALFSSDFRAPERLFALLHQAGGRAGRDATYAAGSELWVQTFYPGHALFAALRQHDYLGFASAQLEERARAGLPPFAFQALLRADARSQSDAQNFLRAALEQSTALQEAQPITLYAPIPLSLQRVAGVERAQMLLECTSRPALQRFLAAWAPTLHTLRTPGVLRWAVDVDPLGI